MDDMQMSVMRPSSFHVASFPIYICIYTTCRAKRESKLRILLSSLNQMYVFHSRISGPPPHTSKDAAQDPPSPQDDKIQTNGIFICVAFNRWYCFPSGFFGRVNNLRWMNPKLLDASLEYQSLILFEWTVSSPWLNSEGHSKQPNGDDNAKTNSITMWSSSLSKILVYQ